MNNKIICLNSGGFDSICLMNFLAEQGNDILAITFNYGQRNADLEIEKAKKCCEKLGAEHLIIDLPKFDWIENNPLFNNIEGLNHYIAYRNLIFCAYATSIAETRGIKDVYLAIIKANKGDVTYKDSKLSFYKAFNKLIKESDIRFVVPFAKFTKEEIMDLTLDMGIEKDDFITCNTPIVKNDILQACGTCVDCKLIDLIYEEYKL